MQLTKPVRPNFVKPIFHFEPARIRAHLAICYLAFTGVQHLGYRLRQLGYPMSPEVVRRELNALQMSILWRVRAPRTSMSCRVGRRQRRNAFIGV